MNILVTGGAGFIGSHLCERLLKEHHEVTIIDEMNDFYSPELKRENLGAIEKVGSFKFFQRDICDADTVMQVVGRTTPDAIIHLAARAGVRPSLEQPLLYEKVNVQGTLVLLEACRYWGVPKFIFASSSSIYGKANRTPFSENDHLNLPISPYAATKIAGEKLCYTYSHLYGIQALCLRFFTVYGPRQRPDLAIRKFTKLIRDGRPIPMFGDGSASRDYTFIDDIIDGILAALNYDCSYEVFNLGNSHPVDLKTVIRMIEANLGKTALVERLPEQSGDVPITYADISKAARLLHYSPRTPLSEGIQKFAVWYLEHQAERATSRQTAAAIE